MPLINGVEHSWSDIVVNLAGVPDPGVTAIDYADEQEMENIYAAGQNPVARGYGRITPSATITMLKSSVEALQSAAPSGRLQDIAPFDIVVTYMPNNGTRLVKHVIKNCQFKKNQRSWKEGDMKQEVALELLPSHVIWNA